MLASNPHAPLRHAPPQRQQIHLGVLDAGRDIRVRPEAGELVELPGGGEDVGGHATRVVGGIVRQQRDVRREEGDQRRFERGWVAGVRAHERADLLRVGARRVEEECWVCYRGRQCG